MQNRDTQTERVTALVNEIKQKQAKGEEYTTLFSMLLTALGYHTLGYSDYKAKCYAEAQVLIGDFAGAFLNYVTYINGYDEYEEWPGGADRSGLKNVLNQLDDKALATLSRKQLKEALLLLNEKEQLPYLYECVNPNTALGKKIASASIWEWNDGFNSEAIWGLIKVRDPDHYQDYRSHLHAVSLFRSLPKRQWDELDNYPTAYGRYYKAL